MNNGLTAVLGLEVGHYTDKANATGCTVVLARHGAVGGVDVRGPSSGTRETDLLRAENEVQKIHAIVLSGGSAYGLSTADGVMRYLEEQGIGHRVGSVIVPIVPAAIWFDLNLISSSVRPGDREGYIAARNATAGWVEQGSVGAGTGAIVGKALGKNAGMKGGIGTASLDLGGGLVVGALVAVNAVGGVNDPSTGHLLAGPRSASGAILDSVDVYSDWNYGKFTPGITGFSGELSNTTIGVIATSAVLSKGQSGRLAQVAHDGLALAIRPCHTLHDGDTLFALATGLVDAPDDFGRICAVAPSVTASAVVNAIRSAEGLGGIPSWTDLADLGGQYE